MFEATTRQRNAAAAAEAARRHSSCRANHGNDCFKMSRSSGAVEVISFHCEQTEASLRGNRPLVWPYQRALMI